MIDVHGYKTTGTIVNRYDNIVILEDAEGLRHVVHKRELDPNFKPTQLHSLRERFEQATVRNDTLGKQAIKKNASEFKGDLSPFKEKVYK